VFDHKPIKDTMIVSPRIYNILAKEFEYIEDIEKFFCGKFKIESCIYLPTDTIGYYFDEEGVMHTIIFEGLDDVS